MDIQTLFFPTPSIETKIYSPSRFQCTHPSSQFPLLDTRRAKRLGGEGEREVLSSWAWCAFLPHHSTHVRTDRFLTGSVLIDFVDLRAMYITRFKKFCQNFWPNDDFSDNLSHPFRNKRIEQRLQSRNWFFDKSCIEKIYSGFQLFLLKSSVKLKSTSLDSHAFSLRSFFWLFTRLLI